MNRCCRGRAELGAQDGGHHRGLERDPHPQQHGRRGQLCHRCTSLTYRESHAPHASGLILLQQPLHNHLWQAPQAWPWTSPAWA